MPQLNTHWNYIMAFFMQEPKCITHAKELNVYLEEIQLNKTPPYYTASITTPFNLNTNAHLEIINKCNTELASKYNAIKKLDVQIATGSLVGIVAFGLSYILPLSLVAIAGFAFAAYSFGQREKIANEFKSALNNSVRCMYWSLNQIPEDQSEAILKSEAIKTMTKILAPLTSTKQLEGLIDDKYENEFIRLADNTKKTTMDPVLRRSLTKEEQHLVFGIYGYDQENPLNIGKGLLYAVGQLFITAKNAISNQFNKQKPKTEVAANSSIKTHGM